MRRAAFLVLMILLFAGPSRAGETSPPPILAYYRADPRNFNPSSAWMSGFIRLLDAAGVVPLREQPVADGVLAATVLGTYPHSVTLLDLRAKRLIPGKVEIDRAQAVLTVEAPGQFASLRQTLATILSHYGQPEEREQAALKLPGDREGVTYRLKGWPEWLAVEWFAERDRFYLAVGAGALSRFFDEVEGQAKSKQLAPHRGITRGGAATRPADDPIELYFDIAALRRSAPTLFQTGRLSPLLELFQLENAESWMLHGWWSGKFLMFAVTATRGGATASRVLTHDAWPGDAGIPQPEGGFYLVAPIDWPAAVDRVVEVIRITRGPDKRPAFEAKRAAYHKAAGVELAAFLGQFRPILLMSDYPRAWLPIPGTATVYAPLREGTSEKAARARFAALMQPILEGLPVAATQEAEPSGLTVVHDEESDVYWIDSPLRQLFKAPAWGWAATPDGGVLVSSFSPTAVIENRKWLAVPLRGGR